MAQCGWTVLGNRGRHYKIGLYHGDQSGHLVVHCNAKVMLIDFSVLQSKSYTFFLDEQLYELRLERSGDSFRYSCELNAEADTPYNRERKIVEKRNWRKTGWVAAAFFATLVIASIVIIRHMKRLQAEQAQESSWVTEGRGVSTIMRVDFQDDSWQYSFAAGDEIAQGLWPQEETLAPYGFPLTSGDEFAILYHPDFPAIYRILWDELPGQQVQRYFDRTIELHQEEHSELAPRQVRCQVQVAYELEGLPGLAMLYHQTATPAEDAPFDKNAYLRFTRSEAFKEETRNCL